MLIGFLYVTTLQVQLLTFNHRITELCFPAHRSSAHNPCMFTLCPLVMRTLLQGTMCAKCALKTASCEFGAQGALNECIVLLVSIIRKGCDSWAA